MASRDSTNACITESNELTIILCTDINVLRSDCHFVWKENGLPVQMPLRRFPRQVPAEQQPDQPPPTDSPREVILGVQADTEADSESVGFQLSPDFDAARDVRVGAVFRRRRAGFKSHPCRYLRRKGRIKEYDLYKDNKSYRQASKTLCDLPSAPSGSDGTIEFNTEQVLKKP